MSGDLNKQDGPASGGHQPPNQQPRVNERSTSVQPASAALQTNPAASTSAAAARTATAAPTATASGPSTAAPTTKTGLETVVDAAVAAVVDAAVFQVAGSVAAGSATGVLGVVIAEAIKPVLTSALNSLITSVADKFKTQDTSPQGQEATATAPREVTVKGGGVEGSFFKRHWSSMLGGANATSGGTEAVEPNNIQETTEARVARSTEAIAGGVIEQKISYLNLIRKRSIVFRTDLQRSDDEFSIAFYDVDAEGKDLGSNHDYKVFEEVIALDADVICLQSINEKLFLGLQRELLFLGYEAYRKFHTESEKFEAIFHRVQRFLCMGHDGITFKELIAQQAVAENVAENQALTDAIDSSERVIGVTLSCTVTAREIIVVNTRLANSTLDRMDLQTVQLLSILKSIRSGYSVILAGNLGFSSSQAPFQVLLDGQPSKETRDLFHRQLPGAFSKQNPILLSYMKGFEHKLKMASAYSHVTGAEAATHWNGTEKALEQGSFILYDSKELSAVGILSMPARELVGMGIPNDRLPSAHLSLKTWMTFRKN